MKKKFLSYALVASMAVTSVPTTALAETPSGVEESKDSVSAQSASVAEKSISGKVGEALAEDQTVTITLEDGDTFNSITAGEEVTGWFEGLPTGLKAKIQDAVEADATEATVLIYGEPEVAAESGVSVTIKIPAENIKDGSDEVIAEGTVTVTIAKGEIQTASATVGTPMDGQKPSEVTVESGDSEQYTVAVEWKEVDADSGTETELTAGDTFTANKKYKAVVTFTATTNYTLVTGCTYKINNEEIELNSEGKCVVEMTAKAVAKSVKITLGEGMTVAEGDLNQTDLEGDMTAVTIKAADDHYFPEDYESKYADKDMKGIQVKREGFTTIKVSGTPTANVDMTLTDATAKEKEETPEASFVATDSDKGTLGDVTSGMQYSINGGTSWTNISGSDTSVSLEGLTVGEEILQVKKTAADTDTRLDSDAQKITLTQAEKPSNLGTEDETSALNDGQITGLIAGTKYQYRSAGDGESTQPGEWKDITASEDTTAITGLKPDTYDVRIAADGTALASDSVQKTINKYRASVQSLTVNVDNTGKITVSNPAGSTGGTRYYYVVAQEKTSAVDNWYGDTDKTAVEEALGVEGDTNEPTLTSDNNDMYLVVVEFNDNNNVVARGYGKITITTTTKTNQDIVNEAIAKVNGMTGDAAFSIRNTVDGVAWAGIEAPLTEAVEAQIQDIQGLGEDRTITITPVGDITPATNGANDDDKVPGSFKYTVKLTKGDGDTKGESTSNELTGTITPITVFTVSFDSNGGSGDMSSVKLAPEGEATTVDYTLPECTFATPDGMTFDGWATSVDGTKLEGTSTTISSNITLYALWKDDDSTEKTVTSIAVKTQPDKTEYEVGDTLDLTGMVLTVTYDDNTTEEVATGYTGTPEVLDTVGDAITVTITYAGKTTTLTVEVNAAAKTNIQGHVTFIKQEYTYDGTAKTPSIEFDDTFADLTADDYTVTYATTDDVAVPSTEAPVDAGTYQMIVTVKDDHAKYTGSDRATFTINKANQDKPSGLTGVVDTTGTDPVYKITGTTAAMEYAETEDAADEDWTACGENETEVTKAGQYYVRHKGNRNYNASASFAVSVDVDVKTFTLTVVNGTSEGTEFKEGDLVTIVANAPEVGVEFVEWTGLDNVEIVVGSTKTERVVFKMPAAAVTAVAIYDAKVETTWVEFHANGGYFSDTTGSTQRDEISVEVVKGEKVQAPATPVRSGYRFTGWFTDEAATKAFDLNTPIEDYTYLYAGWARRSSGGSSGGGGGSSSSSNSNTATTPTTPATDAKSETTTETNPDGSTTTTVTNPDGSSVETTTYPDGSKTVTETDENGAQTITETRADGTEVRTEISRRGEVSSDITLPEGADEVTVKIPTENRPTAGTVAVIVNPDGTREILLDAVVDRDGVTITLDRDAKVEIIDNARVFNDVPSSSWAKESIDFVTARELFAGVSDTEFGHNSPMTRAMLMTVLARLDGQDTSGGATWYENGMNWAIAKGISDGTNPNGTITREQLAAMLYRYAGSPATSGSLDIFLDSGRVSGYAVDALRWAVEQGIISGMGDGTLDPQGNATRAQVAAMLMRFMNAMN